MTDTPSTDASAADPSSGDYRILYVDDEEMALKYFRRFVGREFIVHTATSVDEALEVLAVEGESIGVLITDQRMPGQSGVDLLKKVRARWPHIVRLLTTAYADLEDAIEAVNRGEIFRYLTKPWDTQTLRTELRQAMEVFTLRHERAALMREKMSVWQRLVQLGRLRDLVVMAHSLPGLRNSDHAVVAYLDDHLGNDGMTMAAPERLDLWEVTETEIAHSLAIVKMVRSAIDRLSAVDAQLAVSTPASVISEYAARHDLALRLAEGSLPDVMLAEAAVDPLCRALADCLAGGEGRPQGEIRVQEVADGLGLRWTRTNSASQTADASLLIVYLLAHHHGGAVSCDDDGSARAYRLYLPSKTDIGAPTPLATGWLESLLVRLESWE